jgi:hypothetical protein
MSQQKLTLNDVMRIYTQNHPYAVGLNWLAKELKQLLNDYRSKQHPIN